jgi:hypothetical protein
MCSAKKNVFEIVFVALASLILTGCGGGSSNVSDFSSPNGTSSEIGSGSAPTQGGSSNLPNTVSTPVGVFPLFANSIVSTDIDFITSDDPTSYIGSDFDGRLGRELVGRIIPLRFDNNTFVYTMHFSDSKSIEAWLDSGFNSRTDADEYLEKLGLRLGKSPAFMRDELSHVVINNANEVAFAEELGRFFVLSSENMDARIAENDLEETIFHELIHASIEVNINQDPSWASAQSEDAIITRHALTNPNEDLAETAIFIYTLQNNPERLDTTTREWISDHLPNKRDYLLMVF